MIINQYFITKKIKKSHSLFLEWDTKEQINIYVQQLDFYHVAFHNTNKHLLSQ